MGHVEEVVGRDRRLDKARRTKATLQPCQASVVLYKLMESSENGIHLEWRRMETQSSFLGIVESRLLVSFLGEESIG